MTTIQLLVVLVFLCVGFYNIINGLSDLFNPSIKKDWDFIKQDGKKMVIVGFAFTLIGVIVSLL